MSQPDILAVTPLAQQWQTLDPFLFCVHHLDAYPEGDARMAPDTALLHGRNIGMDFAGRDGWSMYHGDVVPGFPRHPHRGFETITLARRGYIDHADSLGAAARFGQGDVQWMTAGNGIVHSEMFPLVNRGRANPTELFQIWLNLPAEDKLADPHFTMLWSEDMPRFASRDAAGRTVEIVVVAGELEGHVPPRPPPSSWASRAQGCVAVWTVNLSPAARWSLPPTAPGINRVLYYFAGDGTTIGGQAIERGHAVQVRPDTTLAIENGDAPSEILVLQGRPIGEPVAQHGPFVMNSTGEIRRAIEDYQRTGFGGWPWPADGPVHDRDQGRFARRTDGQVEHPPRATSEDRDPVALP